MYEVAWNKRAVRSIKRIDRKDVRRIYQAIQKLRCWPDCKNVVSLVNHEYDYRLRVGRYRVFFTIDDIIRIVWIEEVKKRDEQTY
jgi:mRNA-degrading endonuclease RelE of RelBE toxin-antitoxin system